MIMLKSMLCVIFVLIMYYKDITVVNRNKADSLLSGFMNVDKVIGTVMEKVVECILSTFIYL